MRNRCTVFREVQSQNAHHHLRWQRHRPAPSRRAAPTWAILRQRLVPHVVAPPLAPRTAVRLLVLRIDVVLHRAAVRRRYGGLGRGRHRRWRGHLLVSLMRHFRAPRPVLGLAGRVSSPTSRRGLVPTPSLAQRPSPRRLAARAPAVPLPAVTPATEQELPPAGRPATDDEAQRVHSTRREPVTGGRPVSALPRAHHERATHTGAPSRGALQSCPGGPFVFVARSPRVVPHSPPTSFQSPPRTPPRQTVSQAVLRTTSVMVMTDDDYVVEQPSVDPRPASRGSG
jgi:hypothetical protein